MCARYPSRMTLANIYRSATERNWVDKRRRGEGTYINDVFKKIFAKPYAKNSKKTRGVSKSKKESKQIKTQVQK